MGEHEVQVWHDAKGIRLRSLTASVDPSSDREIGRLLRGEAAALHYPVDQLSLRIWDGRRKKWVTHRA